MGLIEDTPVPISQYEKEFNYLLDVYRLKSPLNILEIGTHHGGTLYQWITNAPDEARISAIDDQHINSISYGDWAAGRVFIDWFKGDSTSLEAIEWAADSDPYDFIFIDGDHTYNGVLKDWTVCKNLIAPDGIVALHDIAPHPNRQVDLLWEDLKLLEYNWEEVVDLSYPEDERCGIGIVYFD